MLKEICRNWVYSSCEWDGNPQLLYTKVTKVALLDLSPSFSFSLSKKGSLNNISKQLLSVFRLRFCDDSVDLLAPTAFPLHSYRIPAPAAGSELPRLTHQRMAA